MEIAFRYSDHRESKCKSIILSIIQFSCLGTKKKLLRKNYTGPIRLDDCWTAVL